MLVTPKKLWTRRNSFQKSMNSRVSEVMSCTEVEKGSHRHISFCLGLLVPISIPSPFQRNPLQGIYGRWLGTRITQARSQGGGGGRGGRTTPPQLPIPKILFHPLAILFHPLAILFHLSAILFHPLAILFHPSAILFHPLAILFHPSAILFHPWNMWMTSHGQCPRGGGACECPREWGRFSN